VEVAPPRASAAAAVLRLVRALTAEHRNLLLLLVLMIALGMGGYALVSRWQRVRPALAVLCWRPRTIGVILIILVGGLILAALLMPATQRARGMASTTQCMVNVKNIAMAVMMYRADNGEYPPSLDAVFPDYMDERRENLSCRTAGRFTYAYVRPMSEDAKQAMVYCRSAAHGDGTIVGFADGHVETVQFNEQGDLLNPYTGVLVARGVGRAEAQVAERFSGFQASDEEIQEVAQVQARQAPASRSQAGGDVNLFRGGKAGVREGMAEQRARDFYNLGVAYEERGEYEKAREQYDRAQEVKKDFKQASERGRRVKALQTATQKEQLRVPTSRPVETSEDLDRLAKRLAETHEKGGEAPPPPQEGQPTGYVGDILDSRLAMRESVTGPASEEEEVEGEKPVPRLATQFEPSALVKRAGGGRSLGARPIKIDFPTLPTTAYVFGKAFVGRSPATLGFRALSGGAALIAEVLLGILALVLYLRVQRGGRAVGAIYCLVTLLVFGLLYVTVPPALRSVLATVLLVTAVCLVGEALSFLRGFVSAQHTEE